MERADAASLAAIASVLRGKNGLDAQSRVLLAEKIETIIQDEYPIFAKEMIDRAAFLRRAAEKEST